MEFEYWFFIIGILLLGMAVSGTFISRLPLTTTIFYLVVGLILGPLGIELLSLNPLEETELLERIAEIAVILSLFNAGMKLVIPLNDRAWYVPIKLAFISMIITVGLIALTGYYFLGLPIGLAVILGAVLAPTDPVLASDVQVKGPGDTHHLRFSLTAEAGMNDGTAFPFIMLGLGLMGLHDIGQFGWKWLIIDVLWAIPGGLAVGAGAGYLTSKIIIHLRRKHKAAVGRDEFISLGLLGLAYGTALLLHTYGFLAAFAAGLALRVYERKHSEEIKPEEVPDEEKDEVLKTTPKHLTDSMLEFNEQLENITEAAVVIIIGAVLTYTYLPVQAYWFIPLLFFFVRPAAVYLGLLKQKLPALEKKYLSWFGIRGIGSIYYLMYAINKGIPERRAHQLITFTMIVVVISIIVHGITVTPLMKYYRKREE